MSNKDQMGMDAVMDEKKVDEKLNEAQKLTAQEILLGGEEGFKRIELQSVLKNGKPGVVWIRPLPAREVLAFVGVPKEKQLEAMAPLIGKAVVHEDGSPMFTTEELKQLVDISISVFTELSTVVTAQMKGLTEGTKDVEDEMGEASGGTTSSDSPTN